MLNEYANGVYNRLLNFVLNNGMNRQDKNNPYNVLLEQFVEMLNKYFFFEGREKNGYHQNQSPTAGSNQR